MSKIKISLKPQQQVVLSSNHGKRMARLRQAEEMQHKGYKISEIIQVMETPAFANYFETHFQSYLKVKQAILTTGDQHQSDDSYLDVVNFLNSMLTSINNLKEVTVGERDGLDNIGIRNLRGGARKGMTFIQNGKTEDDLS
jgi:hypothetical protein